MMRGLRVFGLGAVALIFTAAFAAGIAYAFAGQTTRASVNSAGDPANMTVSSGVLSADGRYVVFWTSATNLLAGVSMSGTHVYRHDRLTGATVLVSVATTGNPGNSLSRDPSISANGRYVVFSSFATDLVPTDANGPLMDVFVRDMQTGTTLLVSASSAGVQGDLASGLSGLPGAHEISDDGRLVAFTSFATNLADGTNNGRQQVYVKDTTTGVLVRASVNDAGDAGDRTSQTPAISGNGHLVAFRSESTNFSALSTAGITPEIFARDLVLGTTTLETADSAALGRSSTLPVLSSDGRYLAFVSEGRLDTRDLDNGTPDVYLRNRAAGTTVLVSLSPTSVTGALSGGPSISGDGRWVAFNSIDDHIVATDTNGIIADIFLYDRDSQTVVLASLNDAGDQANAQTSGASLSFDGHLVLFASSATNLVGARTTAGNQLYVRILGSNLAPVIEAGADETVPEGTWLKRYGTFSDVDASTSWTGTVDFGTGALPLGIDPVKKIWFFQHEPLTPGSYVVTLSITDNEGATGSASFRHTVTNVPPVVNLGAEAFLYFDATLHRVAGLSDPGLNWPVPQPAETYRATVDYGDGTGATALEVSGRSFTLDHTYATTGTYVVTVNATDSNGGAGSASLTVHVFKYEFAWLDPVGDNFVVGRNLPVKFTVRAPDGSFVLDLSVRVDVIDAAGNVVAGPYVVGEQPSRSVTWSSNAYHVNVDTRDLAPGMYWLRVQFSSPTLVGEFTLGTTATAGSTTTSTKARVR